MVLRRGDVIRAGLELLDEAGLDKLTTRALTQRLGVQPGALYWHVRSKRELLTAIADEIMAEAFAEPALPAADWREQVTESAHRLRRAMLAHRDGARLIAGHVSMTPHTLDGAERGLSLMRAAGLPLPQAAYFGHAVTSYVLGFVLQEQAVAPQPETVPGLDPCRYPNLAAWQSMRPSSADEAFAAGLSMLTGGPPGH